MIEKPSESHPTNISWQYYANCRNADPELFFSYDKEIQKAAKMICKACEVKADCLEYALKDREHGIWGGTDDDERNAILRERRLQLQEKISEETMLTED